MKPVVNTQRCYVDPRICTAIPACPQQAVRYVEDDDEPIGGRIEFDDARCQGCGACAKACCGQAIDMV